MKHPARVAVRTGTILICFFLIIATSYAKSSAAKVPTYPSPELLAAKSVYIDNQTGDNEVFDAARQEFTTWGRFTVVDTKDAADLTVTFTHKNHMDKWGNLFLVVMDVTGKSSSTPLYQTENGVRFLWDMQHRPRTCVANFYHYLGRKP